jgi:hypothetical protein
MKRSFKSLEYEIIYQILLCELCFDICNSIEVTQDKRDNFLPYYYNLNFIKGLISLHSLLLSRQKGEFSIENYISEYKWNFLKNNSQPDYLQNFEKNIAPIRISFKKSLPIPLRDKIAAHIDESFFQSDFTRIYIMPTLIPEYIKIISELKNVFFEFSNYVGDDRPFRKIKKQSDSVLERLVGGTI